MTWSPSTQGETIQSFHRIYIATISSWMSGSNLLKSSIMKNSLRQSLRWRR